MKSGNFGGMGWPNAMYKKYAASAVQKIGWTDRDSD